MLFTNSIKFPDVFNLTNGNTNVDTEFTSINRCIVVFVIDQFSKEAL